MTADTAIFFDLDGTLVDLPEPYDEVVAATLREHGIDEGLADVYGEAFYAAFSALEPEPVRAGMAAVVEAVDVDADPGAMAETLREREYAASTVDEAVPDSLTRLGEDAALGVLTDGVRSWQVGKLEHHGLAGRFDAVVASYEAGAHKPAPEPFELAAERLPAGEYALVGDDDADVEGARAAGWVPIRYEEPEEGPAFWETVGALL